MTLRQRRSSTFALWGWRRGQLAYWVVPGEFAYKHNLTPIATADLMRDYVTVAI